MEATRNPATGRSRANKGACTSSICMRPLYHTKAPMCARFRDRRSNESTGSHLFDSRSRPRSRPLRKIAYIFERISAHTADADQKCTLFQREAQLRAGCPARQSAPAPPRKRGTGSLRFPFGARNRYGHARYVLMRLGDHGSDHRDSGNGQRGGSDEVLGEYVLHSELSFVCLHLRFLRMRLYGPRHPVSMRSNPAFCWAFNRLCMKTGALHRCLA